MHNFFIILCLFRKKCDMWFQIQHITPIWYFDATGGVIKNVPGQSVPNFYSTIAYDVQNKKYIPIFEFVTTDQTSVNILCYLIKAAKYLRLAKPNKNEFAFPPIVVVDESYAMINSVNECFNKCTTSQYMQFTYDLIVKEEIHLEGRIKTRVYICATHFLHSMIRKTKKIRKFSNKTVKIFLYCFSLLQNSTSFSQFTTYLLNICNVFTNPSNDQSVASSIQVLQTEIANRQLNRLNTNCDEHASTGELSSEIEQTSSPFKQHFEQQIETYCTYQPHTHVSNPHYNLELFNLIQAKLHIVPLWTGILLKQCQSQHPLHFTTEFSRLTNNPVERYFGQLKNQTLSGQKNMYAIELTCRLYTKLKAEYLEHYSDDTSITDLTTNKRSKSKTSNIDMARQIWRPTNTVKRERGKCLF